ncbi:MAG TPA: hypothetical protein VK974_03720 [Methylophilaceae bacterium]|nr:hypothetical protein [Methylophilaceae bacterium]
MFSKIVTLAAILFLVGCASASKTYTAEGKEGQVINCSGTARNWGMCYEKAGQICGTKGYEVLEKTGDKGWVASASTTSANAGSTISRNLLIQCKP